MQAPRRVTLTDGRRAYQVRRPPWAAIARAVGERLALATALAAAGAVAICPADFFGPYVELWGKLL